MHSELVSNSAAADRIHVGCSGWVYRHWKGGFYPEALPQKRWFEHYARDFDTVEINASFYRIPLVSTFDGWKAKAPTGFRYALKANRFLTHMRKLINCEAPLAEFIDLARRLGPTLGPILFQLPPSLHRDVERLEAFLKRLPGDLEHVVEFRHKSWYDEEVLALLDRHGAGFVSHDLKGLVSPRWASGRPPTSASTAPPANTAAATATRRWPIGRTGCSSSAAPAAPAGPILTTTSAATRSRTPGR